MAVNLGRMLESRRELGKRLLARLYPRAFESDSGGGAPTFRHRHIRTDHKNSPGELKMQCAARLRIAT